MDEVASTSGLVAEEGRRGGGLQRAAHQERAGRRLKDGGRPGPRRGPGHGGRAARSRARAATGVAARHRDPQLARRGGRGAAGKWRATEVKRWVRGAWCVVL